MHLRLISLLKIVSQVIKLVIRSMQTISLLPRKIWIMEKLSLHLGMMDVFLLHQYGTMKKKIH